jgi:phage gp45-like
VLIVAGAGCEVLVVVGGGESDVLVIVADAVSRPP